MPYLHRSALAPTITIEQTPRVDEAADPGRFEQLTGVSRHDYEQRMLRTARCRLIETTGGTHLDGYVESVALDGESDDTALVVIFRANDFPGRRFGWRVPVWPVDDPVHDVSGAWPEPGDLLDVHLMEAINTILHGDRTPPDDHGVEWLIEEF